MVLSNLNNNVDVEARAMATMGDTLGRSDADIEGGPGAAVRCSGPRDCPSVWGLSGVSVSALISGRSCDRGPPALCTFSLERAP